MSYMFEVYYKPPADEQHETRLAAEVSVFGGKLTFREEATAHTGLCLTYEFEDLSEAEAAATLLRNHGEHIEGPVDYGDDVPTQSANERNGTLTKNLQTTPQPLQGASA